MFVDTAGWASVVLSTETYHPLAVSLVQAARPARFVTTNLGLGELTAILTRPLRVTKPRQWIILDNLRTDPDIELIFVDASIDAEAWKLWESRLDKDWSFTDCASFVVMQQRGLVEALTTDHHFEHAGFVRLMK